MAERETEFKYSLTQADHGSLQQRLGTPHKARDFINRYYTVEGGTDRRDWVLRLRLDAGVKELTLKIGREVSPGVFDSTEYSATVSSESPQAWAQEEPIRVLRRELSVAPIRVQGEVRNKRLVYPAPIAVGEFWELDETLLPGGKTVYELEVEVRDSNADSFAPMRQELEAWLAETVSRVTPSEQTKYSRFLEAVTPPSEPA